MIRWIAAIPLFLLAFLHPAACFGWAETDYIVDTNYDHPRQTIPKSYSHTATIFYLGEGIGTMSSPQDLFIDGNDTLYVADSGNDRILRFDKDLKVDRVFSGTEIAEASGTGDPVLPGPAGYSLRDPEGLFVDGDGGIFVADTGNGRIVKLSKTGKYVEEFGKPDSELLTDDFQFVPRRVGVSTTGYLYAIRYQWIMQMDAYNQFRGYINATEVGFNLGYLVRKAFSTEKQRYSMQKPEPASCLSFDIAKDGTLYVTTVDQTAQLKKISSINRNIYPKKDMFGHMINIDGEEKLPYFIDLAVTDDDNVMLLESWAGEIHIYDQEGNNLAIFGGLGDSSDEFTAPVAVDTDSRGNIYVLDSASASVKIFAPTQFMQLVYQAVRLYTAGDYVDAVAYWSQVGAINSNYALANKGFAKAYYKQGQWQSAMEYYRLCGDKTGYSAAFDKYRLQFLREHFAPVTAAAIALIVGILLAVRYLLIRINRIIRRYYSRI